MTGSGARARRCVGAGLLACFVHGALDAQVDDELALVGATVHASPEQAPLEDAVVLIRDGRIAAIGARGSTAVPSDARIIDCTGSTVVAGFWNSHVHFFERKWADAASLSAADLARQLEEMLTRYGFTSAFELGGAWANTRALRERIETDEVNGPRIRTTGEVLLAPGAAPVDDVVRALGFIPVRNYEVGDPAAARAAATSLLAAGADGIKLHLQRPPPGKPPLPTTAIEAAVGQAHRLGKPVFVHPTSGADVLAAARAGVDVIAHTTPLTGPWDATILRAMSERGVALTPTLSLWKEALRRERVSLQEQAVGIAVDQLRAWVATGGTVLFGSDLGVVEYDPTEEYELMAAAGMSFAQILASLTTAPAERFGASELGRIAVGLVADLVVLAGDPAMDIRSLADVRYTMRAGEVIFAARGGSTDAR
jgi:imidazolonepropionase-like amidohydrolase